MSDAVDVAIGKGVLSQLQGATLSQPISPERSYADWELALEDNDTLHVDVVVVTTEKKTDLVARNKVRFTVPVDIAVRKRFDVSEQDGSTGRVNLDEIDALALLVQEIYLLFMPQRLTDFPDAVWKSTDILANPDNKSLRTNRQFTGVVRTTFIADIDLT